MTKRRDDNPLLQQPDLGGGQGAPVAPVRTGAPPGVDDPSGRRRGALYGGPERRRRQEDPDRWRAADRRVRPYDYPGQEGV